MTDRAAIGAFFLDEFEKWAPVAKAREPSGEGPYHRALIDIDRALASTIAHMKAQRDGATSKTTGEDLATLWQTASRSLRGLDDNFAAICQYKGLGWIDEAEWDKADQRGLRTDIDFVQDKRDQLSRTPDPDASGVLAYIGTEEKRKRLAFIGTGLAAVIAAGWAAYVHFDPAEKPQAQPITINNTNTNTVSPTISPQMNQNVTVTPPANPSLTLETSFDVCQGQNIGGCGVKGAEQIQCGVDPTQYIKTRCTNFDLEIASDRGGGMCGYRLYHVKCTSTKK